MLADSRGRLGVELLLGCFFPAAGLEEAVAVAVAVVAVVDDEELQAEVCFRWFLTPV